jgi:hypothetical protein
MQWKRVMRYSLATLVILTAAIPPLMAIIWIAAPTDFMRRLFDYCWMPGMGVFFALVAYSILYAPAKSSKLTRPLPVAALVIWCFETLALWIWTLLAIGILGWIFIWGDRGPPSPISSLHMFAALVAGSVSTIASLRIAGGRATLNYVTIIIGMSVSLLVLFAPYFLWYISIHKKLPPLVG